MTLLRTTIIGCFQNTPIFAENLFDKCSADARKSLTTIKQKIEFEKDSVVIAKGDLPDIYILIEGHAKAVYFNQINQKNVSQLIEKNEIIGLIETIGNLRSKTTIKTNSPCIFEIIKQADFMLFLYEQPDICFHLIKTLSFNLNKSYQTFYSSTF